MFFRVLRAGWPLVYAPGMAVRHEHRREHDALRHQYYTWGTGLMAFLAKWYRQVPAADRRTIRRLLRLVVPQVPAGDGGRGVRSAAGG